MQQEREREQVEQQEQKEPLSSFSLGVFQLTRPSSPTNNLTVKRLQVEVEKARRTR